MAEILVARGENAEDEEAMTFSQHLACTYCGISFDELAPRNFSFNSPYGACPACNGLGTRFEVDPELVAPNISPACCSPWRRPTGSTRRSHGAS